jgi:hypothetical protein
MTDDDTERMLREGHQTEHGTVYGPNATAERAQKCAAVIAAIGVAAELLARRIPETSCVLFGVREEVVTILPMFALETPDDTHALTSVPREALADRLRKLGREGDAAKVIAGPPHAPLAHLGSRLLVLAVDGLVAVEWSQPPRPFFFNARHVL